MNKLPKSLKNLAGVDMILGAKGKPIAISVEWIVSHRCTDRQYSIERGDAFQPSASIYQEGKYRFL